MPNTAQNLSTPIANTSHITLHNPADRTSAVYQFDSLEAAQTFKQNHCLSAYRIAGICFFDDAPCTAGSV